jgi:predicted small lipoprotein YifL
VARQTLNAIRALAACVTITGLSACGEQTPRPPAETKAATREIQTRVLDQPEVEHPATFTSIDGVRELRDGRLLVLDSRERSVQILDLQNSSSVRVGRSGKGPGEYVLPVRLIPLTGDSSGIVDEVTARILVVLPDGTTGGVLPLRPPGRSSDDPVGWLGGGDERGFLYARGMVYRETATGVLGNDSVPIFRYVPGQSTADTIAWIRQQATKVTSNMRGNARAISVRLDPFAAEDQWAVSLDGRVATANVDTYEIRWIDAAGNKTFTPPIAFTPVPFTEAHKQAWLDAQRKDVAVIVDGDNGTVTTRPSRPGREEERLDWPQFLPPFLRRALRFAPDGKLWVQRTGPADMPPTFDIIDANAGVTQKVVLPVRTRLVGFGSNGAMYVVRTDNDDLQHLQRYRLN